MAMTLVKGLRSDSSSQEGSQPSSRRSRAYLDAAFHVGHNDMFLKNTSERGRELGQVIVPPIAPQPRPWRFPSPLQAFFAC